MIDLSAGNTLLQHHCPGAELIVDGESVVLRRGTAMARMSLERLSGLTTLEDGLVHLLADAIAAAHPVAESSAARYLLRYWMTDESDVQVVVLERRWLLVEDRGTYLSFDLEPLIVSTFGLEHANAQALYRRAAAEASTQRRGCRVVTDAEAEHLRAEHSPRP